MKKSLVDEDVDGVKAPSTWTHNDLVRNALRQSVGVPEAIEKQAAYYEKSIDELLEEEEEVFDKGVALDQVTGTLMLDGRPVKLQSIPRDLMGMQQFRIHNKEKRHLLKASAYQTFIDKATGYVLSKNNKLSAPLVSAKEKRSWLIFMMSNFS